MKTRGFTLTELLIVVSIVALLGTLVLASSSRSRAGSRDARRLSDLGQIAIALESYFALNQAYPLSTGGLWNSSCTDATGYVPGLVSSYIGQLPIDPSGCPGPGTNPASGFVYKSDGDDYKIGVTAEIGAECALGKQYYDKASPSHGSTFCSISTPKAAGW